MLNVAIIGYGYWGPKLARNFQNSSFFKIKFIVDNSRKNLLKGKIDHPLSKLRRDYKSLKNEKIDLVVISSPTKSHYVISKYFLDKSHVLVEKPLSMSLREVKILEQVSKKNNKLLFVDYPFLFSGSINYKAKLLNLKNMEVYSKLNLIESKRP